jgi:hypothetical protein
MYLGGKNNWIIVRTHEFPWRFNVALIYARDTSSVRRMPGSPAQARKCAN